MPITLNGDTGIVSPAIDVTTPITVADGGTGLSSVGTSGNVLTSDGTTWTSAAIPSSAPTTEQVLTAMAGMTAGVIGSMAYAYSGTGAISKNQTVAGNTLINSNSINQGFSGTWRSLGAASAGGYFMLWVRIS
jgi:hypothetical protein